MRPARPDASQKDTLAFILGPDPYVDVARIGSGLERDVDPLDQQLVGEAAGRRDGFDREQRKMLVEPDQSATLSMVCPSGAVQS